MKLFTVENGSPEWFAARSGIPTASAFHRVLTPAKGELASGRWSYAFELAIERLLGESKQTIDGLQWVERGKMLEPDAVQHYEFVHSCRTVKAGFITTDDGRMGCSPDRIMVDEVGGLELKCPAAKTHLDYFIRGPGADYRCQVQGSLLITGFPFWDFMSYSPNLPQVLVRFEPDAPFIEKLKAALDQFCDEVDEICEKVRAAGYVPPAHLANPWDAAYGEMLRSDMNAAGHIIEQGSWGGD
jgi:hypothetical protein